MAFLAIAGLLALLGWFLRNRQTRLERESKVQLREQATGIRSALLDITARVAAEQRMQSYLSDLEAAREELAADYLSKPVGPAELATALERWLAKDSPETTEPVFEKAAFLSRVMGDEDLAQAITEAFLDDMPAQIEKLASAVAAGDIRKVELQAHQIKGASANVGGEALRGAAGEMEESSRAGRLEALRTLLPELKERFAQLKEAMEKDVGGGSDSEGGHHANPDFRGRFHLPRNADGDAPEVELRPGDDRKRRSGLGGATTTGRA